MTALATPLRTKSLAHYAKGTRSPFRAPTYLYVSHFRYYFIPLSGCFSPFPHGTIRYRSLHLFSLGWWSTQIQAGFHVSDPTQEHSTVCFHFAYGAVTLYGRPFQGRSSMKTESDIEVLQPPASLWALCGTSHGVPIENSPIDSYHVVCPKAQSEAGFGLFPVRSPLLRESLS